LRERKSDIATINVQVETEWKAFKGFHGLLYSPSVDIAVGPFATTRRYEAEYTKLINASRTLVNSLLTNFRSNYNNIFSNRETANDLPSLQNFTSNASNKNARCLFAIEIEKSGSRKHRLGDIVNAAALGRMGILVAWDEKVLQSFFRIFKYFKFLGTAGKPTLAPHRRGVAKNVIILTKTQLETILARFVPSR